MKVSLHFLYLINRILCSPLEALFTLLIFILSKDTNATALQLAVIAALKPTVSLVAFYANSYITERKDRIKKFLAISTLIGSLPCFLFPFISNPWFYVISFGIFTASARAAYPAWVEILKSSFDVSVMSKLISKGTSINYLAVIFLPLLFSFWMDQDAQIWKLLFALLAFVHAINLMVIYFLQIPSEINSPCVPEKKLSLLEPWKKASKVIREKPEFLHYLIIFFLGGAGIVALQPILPLYFKDHLHLSYTQLTLAFSFCKGLAFVATSPIWGNRARTFSIYGINGIMNVFTSLFVAFVIAANFNVSWLFVAYIMYGTMQAGADMSWNLSGVIFSKESESIFYSSMNLVLVGLRGCICPFIGQFIFAYAGIYALFISIFVLTLFASFYAFYINHSIRNKDIDEELICVQ
jgi:MFS family permease